jgi:hypothetical protein
MDSLFMNTHCWLLSVKFLKDSSQPFCINRGSHVIELRVSAIFKEPRDYLQFLLQSVQYALESNYNRNTIAIEGVGYC